jgi:hypothetical protein
MDAEFGDGDGLSEYRRHIDLIADSVIRLEELGNEASTMEQVSECLDGLAFLTREHFGMQLRMLRCWSQPSEYLLDRSAIYSEYRRKLARLYIDAMRQDSTVASRLQALCNHLLDDMVSQQATFVALMRSNMDGPRLRRNQRKDSIAQKPSRAVPLDMVTNCA